MVEPLFDPGAGKENRRRGRGMTLDFLRTWHYIHRAAGAKDPAMTWSFGCYLDGELAGVVVLNPPAAGVCQWLYGDDAQWRRRTIAATRVCCTDAAPFNSESCMVSRVLRAIPRLDDRWSTAVAMSDLAVQDQTGRFHSGRIYAASNAWWAGRSASPTWRGFIDPATGARMSRKCGGRNRTAEERPAGWEIERGGVLNRFLWFLGPQEADARAALRGQVQVGVRRGLFPVWVRPTDADKRDRRFYGTADDLRVV